jgi:hypothetical protein
MGANAMNLLLQTKVPDSAKPVRARTASRCDNTNATRHAVWSKRSYLTTALFIKLLFFEPSFVLAAELAAFVPAGKLSTATVKVDISPIPRRLLCVVFPVSSCAPF